MRLAKPSATVIAALGLLLGGALHASAQAKQAPAPAKATQQTAQKAAPKAPAAAAPAKQATGKAAAQRPAKAAKPAAKAKSTVKEAPAKKAAAAAAVARRDPFEPLVNRGKPGQGVPENLPPGPGGLIVATLRVDGVVRAPSGMIAVISNPQQRVYFLREGARLYDGQVEKINLDSVTFRERGKDPFGKPVDRQVIKRLYPRAGEQ